MPTYTDEWHAEGLRRLLTRIVHEWPQGSQEQALAHVRAALAALEGKFEKGGGS